MMSPRINNNIPLGIYNLGNTCYVNSSIQSLLSCDHFNCILLSTKHQESHTQNSIQTCMRCLFEISFIKPFNQHRSIFFPNQLIHPDEFINAIPNLLHKDFKKRQQQDCHEFLQSLIYSLCKDDTNSVVMQPIINNINHINTSTIKPLFAGSFIGIIRCIECSNISTRNEPMFSGIEVSINNQSSLNTALDSYFDDELLSHDNMYVCMNCNKKTNAIKSVRFSHHCYPHILTIQVIRSLLILLTSYMNQLMI